MVEVVVRVVVVVLVVLGAVQEIETDSVVVKVLVVVVVDVLKAVVVVVEGLVTVLVMLVVAVVVVVVVVVVLSSSPVELLPSSLPSPPFPSSLTDDSMVFAVNPLLVVVVGQEISAPRIRSATSNRERTRGNVQVDRIDAPQCVVHRNVAYLCPVNVTDHDLLIKLF